MRQKKVKDSKPPKKKKDADWQKEDGNYGLQESIKRMNRLQKKFSRK